MKRRTKTAAEVDTVTSWRRVYTYLSRAGVTSGIKRQIRRRERREGKIRGMRVEGAWIDEVQAWRVAVGDEEDLEAPGGAP